MAATTPPEPYRCVARHPVISARLECRNTLGEDERLVREVPWNILHPLMMIIESDDIDGSALEEMILRIRLVASGSYRTGAQRMSEKPTHQNYAQ